MFGNARRPGRRNLRFMVLTRAKNQPGPDGVLGTADDIQDAVNTDSPWVDQSQTYTSHASHQVFLREYVNNAAGRPVATGKLLGGELAADAPAGPTPAWPPGPPPRTRPPSCSACGSRTRTCSTSRCSPSTPTASSSPDPLRGLPQYVTDHRPGGGRHRRPGRRCRPTCCTSTRRSSTDIAHNAEPRRRLAPTRTATPPRASARLRPARRHLRRRDARRALHRR